MATITTTKAKAILDKLGWRTTGSGNYERALIHFQQAWQLGTRLEADGILGPKTSAALLESEKNLKAGKNTASTHFSFDEFACHCGGKYDDCQRIWVTHALIATLERLRATAYPGGLDIVSGNRCVEHNADVHGAVHSRHLSGDAVDIPPKISYTQMQRLELWTGIGYDGDSLRVRHVDLRPGNKAAPTRWAY